MSVCMGDTVEIDGVVYRFGPSSVAAYNFLISLFEKELSPKIGGLDLHLFSADGKGGELFSIGQLKEALGEK